MSDNRDEQRRRAGQAGRSALGTFTPSARSGLTVTTTMVAHSRVLNLYGVLDATTYARLRDAIVTAAALDGYRAVIIDVTRLVVAAPAPWSQFTSACEQVAEWSHAPMALVCDSLAGQKTLRRSGISREIPVYWRVAAAIAALPDNTEHPRRPRARTESRSELRRLDGWLPFRWQPAMRPGSAIITGLSPRLGSVRGMARQLTEEPR